MLYKKDGNRNPLTRNFEHQNQGTLFCNSDKRFFVPKSQDLNNFRCFYPEKH